jgi:nucleoside-diphosphate-sugar epimerase
MKILLTGGAGYIGTTLTPLLLEKGHTVTVFDCLLFNGAVMLPYFQNKNFNFIKGDIRDKEALQKACAGQDVIVHLAAIVGFPACRENPELSRTTNVEGTKNLANCLSKDQYVLFGSTGSNYGSLVNAICTEKTPLNALSIYGKTKTEAEEILMNNTTCTAYRFATAFGISPRLRLDLLINDFTFQAVRQKYLVVYEANFMRTFIHVRDIARSFLFAIENKEKMKNEVYNVGSDKMNHSKREVCEQIAKKTGAHVHYADVGEDADKRNYVVSYEKLNNLGFDTKITIDEGIDELIKISPAIKINNPYSNV